MNACESACRDLENSIPFVLQRISAGAFFERHDKEIRNHAVMQPAIAKAGRNSNPPTIVAMGKMASSMAFEFVERYELSEVRGVVSEPYDSRAPQVRGLDYFQGGHPVPNEDSLAAATAALKILRGLSARDTVIYLISGGGSACFELPDTSISLADIQSAYATLTACGAGIREINTIRQRLSLVKGGKLAAATDSRQQFSLVVSDVRDDELQFVSSGPSIAGDHSYSEITGIIKQYALTKKLPQSVIEVLANLEAPASFPERSGKSICIGSNTDAIDSAREFFHSLGWQCKVDQTFDYQPIEIAVPGLLNSLHSIESNGTCCVIAGGEVVSPVVGKGQGGRNQAFVLECVPQIAGRDVAVMSFGTDGKDGNSSAAGAIANSSTMARCAELKIDVAKYAMDSNSFEVFSQVGGLIETGPTETNVCDLRVLVRC